MTSFPECYYTYDDYGRAYAGGNGAAGADVRFKFTQFADIELDTAPPYLVDGILPRIGVVVVWGPPKCGKTFWVFDIEMHVALGREYRGRRVEQGVVLHIACEGVAGLGARKEAWRIARLAEEAEDAAVPFYLCKDTTLDLIADADKVIKDIGIQYGALAIRIITIDTLNRSLVGSESKDEDMTKYLRAAVALAAQFQCLVMIIHHCGYDATHPRGHTSLRGGADAEISVKKDAAGRVLTKVETMRDGPDGAQTLSRLAVVEVGLDDNGNPIASCVIEPDDTTTNATSHTAKAHLSPKDQIALDILKRALAAEGLLAPTHNHIPPHVTVVAVDLWRRFYLAGTSADGQSEDTRRKAWRDARDRLQAKQFISLCDELVWTS
jgi:hypothetical protein